MSFAAILNAQCVKHITAAVQRPPPSKNIIARWKIVREGKCVHDLKIIRTPHTSNMCQMLSFDCIISIKSFIILNRAFDQISSLS